MILFPAIDILDNNAVRLEKGLREKVTIYGNPIEIAKEYEAIGAEYLHVVDLNGAFDSTGENLKVLKELVNSVNIPIQLGGGIKSLEKAKYYLEEVGVERIILGTICVSNQKLTEEICQKYKGRIVAGIDVVDGYAATHGWVSKSNIKAIDLAEKMKLNGVDTIVYTDISRDGCLTGLNIDATYELQKQSNMNVIASGGLKSLDDIRKVKEKGIYGAILGKALYEKKISLKDALAI